MPVPDALFRCHSTDGWCLCLWLLPFPLRTGAFWLWCCRGRCDHPHVVRVRERHTAFPCASAAAAANG